MAEYYVDKIKYSGNTYKLLDNGALHTSNGLLSGTTSGFKSNGTIAAEQGVFNKLIATSASIGDLDVNNLTANNATVVGLLDVQGELHTNSWTNANIANIGGSFYIAPTVEAVTGTISLTRTVSNNVISWSISTTGNFATDFIKSGDSSSGVTWPANSLVLITGNIVVENMKYPLGTLKGTLGSPVTASAASTQKTITLNSIKDAQENGTPAVLEELYQINGNKNISGAAFSDAKISLYKLGSYPIGIQLSSMGVDSNSIIDIYGGVKTTPTVRIGHLAGLPTINGESPTGWGIYTDNGYFSGVIVSSSGKIGGFDIGTAVIKNTKTSYSETTNNGVWLGTDGIGLGKGLFYVTNAGALTAKSGTIGGITIGGTYLTTNSSRTTYNATTAGLTITTSGIGAGNGSANTFKVDASTGALTAGNATLTGGSIAGWSFNTASLYKNSATPGASTSAMIISTGTSSSNSIGGSSGSNTWMLSAGTGFGVTTTGKLYATGVDITGAIKADSGYISGSVTIGSGGSTITNTLATKASIEAEYSVEIKINSIDYSNGSATLIAVPYQKGVVTTGSFNWYKNNTSTAHGGTISTTTNTNDTLTITDLDASYIAVLQ